MSVAELQKFTAVSKYARWVAELGRREVWPETVARNRAMMQTKYPERADRIQAIYDEHVEPMRLLPSMRGLQFGGPPVFKHAARLYNCSASYVDRLSFFGQAMYLLLCGSGVGYSVQHRHLQHLPNFSRARLAGRTLPKKTFKVPDCIEGWASCSHVLNTSYHDRPVPGFEEWLDCDVEFDYSGVREENSPLSYGIGVAPGPKPLAKANATNKLRFKRLLSEGKTRLDAVSASDMHLTNSDAVVAGGVRRSANIGLFDLNDESMINYKVGNWRETHPFRARANMSAVLRRGRVTWEQFKRLFAATKEFGEPGFFWLSDDDLITNPCAEIGLLAKLFLAADDPELASLLANYDGPVIKDESRGEVSLSGFQMCNLVTINGKAVREADDLFELTEVAAELGTYQAGFTDFPFLGPITERIVRREALLGVSISGIMHNPRVMLDPAVLETAARKAVDRNQEVAKAIGINPAARVTCEKPDGNSASTLGCFPGCHPGKMRRGFRISQVKKTEAPYRHFRSVNPAACEESVWSQHKTDDCVRFCVEFDGALEEDLTAVEFLRHVRTLQNHWVEPGTAHEHNVRPNIRHNISNTVMVRDHEWDGVAREIFDHQDQYGGVSFISAMGSRDYPQAPFTPVFLPAELAGMYGELGCEWARELVAVGPAGPSYVLWNWCDMALGRWELEEGAKPWVDALKRVAAGVFGGDVAKTVYAVKDWYNYQLWEKLRAEYREVDYAAMTGGADVQMVGEVACSSGACEA